MRPLRNCHRKNHSEILEIFSKLSFRWILCVIVCATTCAWGQTKVATWHYNNARTGANTTETILTPANVNFNTFGKLFTQLVDGFVVGQPLYLPSVNIPNQGLHNVVYIATMNDTMYAFDADSGTTPVLWKTSLLPSGATAVPVSVQGCSGTTRYTQIGIVSTPVIDLPSNTIYAVSSTYENLKVVHRLHALDVTTGLERAGSPVVITGSYTQNGITYQFVDTHQMNRPGLLIANGNVYIAFGSPSCNGGDQGWVMAYNKTSLLPEGAFDDQPGGQFAAIWQKGAGISADPSGRIYATTGEGSFSAGVDLPVSVLRLSQSSNVLKLSDWFTPFNWQTLSNSDLDLNNAVLILPTQTGTYPYEALTVGKEGTIYLLNRTSLGHICTTNCTTTDTNIVQELQKVVAGTGSAVYWNGAVYFNGGSQVEVYTLSQGLLSTPPRKSGSVPEGGHLLMTANGNTNGIIWDLSGSDELWAMNAQTLSTLYTSKQAANGRDTVPATAHFATPIVANGKLFIGTQTSLVVYGLLP